MKFNPVLMQMQPRKLVDPIKSIKQNVNIPRVWFRAFTEPQVCEEMNKFVKETNYTHYIINADDLIVYKRAIDNVLMNSPKYDVYTGWCNMHFEGEKMSDLTNVCLGFFVNLRAHSPERDEYPEWETVKDVLDKPFVRQTSNACFGLTCFKKQVLLDYPLMTWPNTNASDHHISMRIQRGAKYTIWTHRDAFCRHLRRGWTPLKDKWLVGNERPKIIYELEPDQYNYDGEREFKFEPLFVS